MDTKKPEPQPTTGQPLAPGQTIVPGQTAPPTPAPSHDQSVLQVEHAHKLHTWLLICTASVVTLIGISLTLLLTHKDVEAPANPAGNITASDSKSDVFYYAKDWTASNRLENSFQNQFIFMNTATHKSSHETLTTAWDFEATSAGHNQPFQFSADGKQYVYGVADHGGADDPYVPKAKSFKLVAGTWKSQSQTIVKDIEPGIITDWMITADGKQVAYVNQPVVNKQAVSTDLFVADTDTGKATKVGAITRPPERDATRLFDVAADHTIRYYYQMEDGVYQTSYNRQDGKISNKKVADKSAVSGGFLGNLSPDGKKLLYDIVDQKANIQIYVIDIGTGKASKLLASSQPSVGYSSNIWSPDSKSVLVNTTPYDSVSKTFKGAPDQLLTVDVDKAAQEEIIKNSPSSGTSDASTQLNCRGVGWSPSGKYIAYTQNDKLYVYDMQAHKTVETMTQTIGNSFDSQSAYGWISR